MSSYDPQERGGAGRTAVAVLLAVAVLAVIGGLFGYLLGDRANEAKASTDRTGGPTTQANTGDPTPANTKSLAPECPDFMQKAAQAQGAKRPLTLRLFIATARSEVWICPDANNKLWYQGHKIENGRFPSEVPQEGVNGLLLSNVNAIDQGRYVAINEDQNGRTDYTVGPQELIIDRKGGNKTTEKVVDHTP